MAAQPTFFFSSTIYDFKDLRGALKFELEQRGCKVLASEHNDFGNELEKNSYDACLKLIDQADYFVLFVGKRVGGMYDVTNGISITRAEYQYAYNRHKAGLIKIIPFVRRSIWDVKSDRAALEKVLNESKLKDSEVTEILNSRSFVVNEAKHVFDFVDEITRKDEFKEALKTNGDNPTGNWVYTFDRYYEVVEVISNSVFGGQSRDRFILQDNLKDVLEELLLSLSEKALDTVYWPSEKIFEISEKYSLDIIDTSNRVIDKDDYGRIGFLIIPFSKKPKVDNQVLLQALRDKLFHEFDSISGAYISTPEVESLKKLIDEIDRGASNVDMASWFEAVQKHNPPGATKFQMPWIELLKLFGEARRRVNIKRLAVALLRTLYGNDFTSPPLVSPSPIAGVEEEMKDEVVKKSDLFANLKIELQ